MLCTQFSDLNMVNSSDWPKMNKYNTQIDDDDVFMVGFNKEFKDFLEN